ncbi:MAG: ATP-binding protein [Roseovarius sp.]|nr:ATP-binding protein [Roseovarius sp.]MCY4208266.1 ATP-binding protein [Roseovarius sp.]MCY4293182.1 ATP-binding protein [Roseovarius sp.]
MINMRLKPYLPKRLYGRAMLILLLPVITVILVVSVVFIQRHFEGVTRQMTNTASREVMLVLEFHANGEQKPIEQLSILNIAVEDVPMSAVPDEDYRVWYDFTGKVVTDGFRKSFPKDLLAVMLPENKIVHLYFLNAENGDRAVKISFDRHRVSASNPHQLLVNMIFFAVVMTLIAFLYMRNQLRPIALLARAAEAFGRGQHLEYRPAGAVEVRAAGKAFVDMRTRIEHHIEQRTLMLSGVSHDLRTPLTRLKLALAMLEKDERRHMEQDIAEIEQLIGEFLDFAKDAKEDETKLVDPHDLVAGITEDFRRSSLNVSMLESVGEGMVALRPSGIRRAVENLVGNAVRYGTRAMVSVIVTEKYLRIVIEDDGSGIEESFRDEAMKPFTRLDDARNQNLGPGVGLGLAIAHDIARAHGGNLILGKSERLGGLKAEIQIVR